MKLSKTQQALLNTMRNMKTGERVTRHWQSNNYIVHLGTGIEHAREATVKALIRAGLVKEYPHPGNHQYMLLILNRAESPISYAADDGSQNRQSDDITPDVAGEKVDDAVTVALPAYQRSWRYYEVQDLVYSLNVYRDWLRGNGFAETLTAFRHTLTNEMHAIFDTENPLVRS